MHRPFLVGDRIYLRPLELKDVTETYVNWLNDQGVTRFLQTGMLPTTKESLRRYVQQGAQSPDTILLAVVEKGTNLHMGNVKLGPAHWLHHRADLGIMIGDKVRWGRGYGREIMELVLNYAFDRLNLHKVTLGVEAEHQPAVRLYEDVGFQVEGIQRAHLFRDGEYRDNLMMGLLREDYRKGRRNGHVPG